MPRRFTKLISFHLLILSAFGANAFALDGAAGTSSTGTATISLVIPAHFEMTGGWHSGTMFWREGNSPGVLRIGTGISKNARFPFRVRALGNATSNAKFFLTATDGSGRRELPLNRDSFVTVQNNDPQRPRYTFIDFAPTRSGSVSASDDNWFYVILSPE